MKVTTPALAAAFRIACTHQVRTHVRSMPEVLTCGAWPTESQKLAEARKLQAQGMTRKEIARTVRIGADTLRKYFGPIQTRGRRRK